MHVSAIYPGPLLVCGYDYEQETDFEHVPFCVKIHMKNYATHMYSLVILCIV